MPTVQEIVYIYFSLYRDWAKGIKYRDRARDPKEEPGKKHDSVKPYNEWKRIHLEVPDEVLSL